jgi:hypothetical protein
VCGSIIFSAEISIRECWLMPRLVVDPLDRDHTSCYLSAQANILANGYKSGRVLIVNQNSSTNINFEGRARKEPKGITKLIRLPTSGLTEILTGLWAMMNSPRTVTMGQCNHQKHDSATLSFLPFTLPQMGNTISHHPVIHHLPGRLP